MKSHFITILFCAVGAFLIVVGFLFKIQHWPYGSEMLVIGQILVVLAALYAIYQSRHQKKD